MRRRPASVATTEAPVLPLTACRRSHRIWQERCRSRLYSRPECRWPEIQDCWLAGHRMVSKTTATRQRIDRSAGRLRLVVQPNLLVQQHRTLEHSMIWQVPCHQSRSYLSNGKGQGWYQPSRYITHAARDAYCVLFWDRLCQSEDAVQQHRQQHQHGNRQDRLAIHISTTVEVAHLAKPEAISQGLTRREAKQRAQNSVRIN